MLERVIETLKIDGQIDALSSAIDSKIFEITNRIFQAFKADRKFKGLHQKLEAVRFLCDAIDELLAEVAKLDGKST